jgi:hypothetical protein
MGSSCGPLLAQTRIFEMAGPRNPRRPSRDPNLLPPPDPDGLLFRGRTNRGKCRFAGNCLIVDAMVAPHGAHALIRMAVVGRRGFPSTTRRPMPVLIVGEPHRGPAVGAGCYAARPSRSEPLRPIRPGGPAGRRRTDVVDLR